MNRKRSDELSFLTNLEAIKKQQSQKRFFDALADFFVQLKMVLFKKTAVATIEVLQNQIEKLHIENSKTEELYRNLELYSKSLEKANIALEDQLSSLLGDVVIEELPKLQKESDDYKKSLSIIKEIYSNYQILNSIADSIQIANVTNEMENALNDCVDDFQKLKIYKKYFEKFVQIPKLAFKANQFLEDKKLFKDKEQLTAFLALLKQDKLAETQLNQFLIDNHPKINDLFEKLIKF